MFNDCFPLTNISAIQTFDLSGLGLSFDFRCCSVAVGELLGGNIQCV